MDGGWTNWSEPGECSTTCGSGQKVKTRSCTNPKPLFGGKDCVGENQYTVACFERNCPGILCLLKIFPFSFKYQGFSNKYQKFSVKY